MTKINRNFAPEPMTPISYEDGLEHPRDAGRHGVRRHPPDQ